MQEQGRDPLLPSAPEHVVVDALAHVSPAAPGDAQGAERAPAQGARQATEVERSLQRRSRAGVSGRQLTVDIGAGHAAQAGPPEALEAEGTLLRDPQGEEEVRGAAQGRPPPVPGLRGAGEADGKLDRCDAPVRRRAGREGPHQGPARIAAHALEGAETAQEDQGTGHDGIIIALPRGPAPRMAVDRARTARVPESPIACPMSRLSRLNLGLLALPLSLASCHLHAGSRFVVDGVRLDAHHEEVLTLESLPAGGLVLESHQGDITVERGPGPIELIVQVHEQKLGDAHLHLDGNRLVSRTADGSTSAIGRIRLRTDRPLADLTLTTGMGDIELTEVEVSGRLQCSTGMGDLVVRAAGKPDAVELSTGMGDVLASGLTCRKLAASSGMGDVDLDGVTAEEARLSSGMGDVSLVRCSGKTLEADTGLGDLDLVESSFETRELSTGLGSVDSR